MSGHSKWATIKHKKGAADKARGKLFNKLARQLEVAARAGGGDPESNPTLRTAIQKAKGAQMTNDAIDRAVKRGTGEAGGDNYESIMYEGYAPGGVALLIDVLTDNRNRSGADDVTDDGGTWRVTSDPSKAYDVKAALEAAGFAVESTDTPMVSDNLVPIGDLDGAKKLLRLVEAMEDNDDVQDVFANFDIADDVMNELMESE
jgi:transcriptional/translational regulatory protein YebC/TACO1